MSGSKIGGIKAAKTNKERHGEDFYARIGAKGGRVTGVEKGFAANNELAKAAGRKGGKASRRTGVKNGEGKGRTTTKKPEKKSFLSRVFGGK